MNYDMKIYLIPITSGFEFKKLVKITSSSPLELHIPITYIIPLPEIEKPPISQ